MPVYASLKHAVTDKYFWRNGLILAGIYFLLARFGLSFTTVATNVTLIWPPTGLALFALLTLGIRYWPWITLGALAVNLSTGISASACLVIAIGNTLEAVIAAHLLQRANFDNHLSRVRDVLMLVFIAAGFSTMFAATFGALALTIFAIIPWQSFSSAWVTWWMGDALGALVITPLLLSWWFRDHVSRVRGNRYEVVLLLVSVMLVTQLVFAGRIPPLERELPLAFMTFPFLIWAALRYDMRGATTVVFLISAILLVNIIFKQGIFAQGSIVENLTLLWLYTNFMAITSLVLAAAISERHLAEMGMRHLATHDHLTGLPNRIALQDRIEHAISLAQRHHKSFAVLFLDIDRFKLINDSLGHPVGDAMLRDISQRLASCVRKEDTVSRLGGDEFVILIEEVTRPDDIYLVTKKIIDAVREPIRINEHELHTSTSIGVCMYPHDGNDADTLLKHADIAMYRAKDLGRNTYFFYTPDMNVEAEKRLHLENELRSAYYNHEFILHYQPQYDINERRIKCAEALIRWNKTPEQCVNPEEFIPVLEENGQIIQVGAWVIDQACYQLANWHAAGYTDMRITVNLSSYQLMDPGLASFIIETLDKYHLAPAYLELEITESMLVRQEQVIAENCEKLIDLGVRLAVDDFGTGYSSLSYLHRLSIDTLKIDRSFIEQIPGNADSEAIARAIVGLGKSLQLTLVAEGVENQQQCTFIRDLGCDAVQGYLLSKPLTVKAFESLLAQSESGTLLDLDAPCTAKPG